MKEKNKSSYPHRLRPLLASGFPFILGIAFSNVYFYLKPYYRSMLLMGSSETLFSTTACDQIIQTGLKTAAAETAVNAVVPNTNNEDSSSSSGTTSTSFPVIDYPKSVRHVVINIGSNLDPLMPDPKKLGPCARAIAVEPIVGCKIKSHPQLDVIHAAIGGGGTHGVASMRMYNTDGVSSSLVKPTTVDYWNNETLSRHDGSLRLTPIITLESLLNSIPRHVQIVAMKTDMQGYDFVALKGAGNALVERVPYLMTEVWDDDIYSYDAKNDLCRDWLPYMTKLGYDLVKTTLENDPTKVIEYCERRLKEYPVRPSVNASAGMRENDAYWIRRRDAHNVTTLRLSLTLPRYKPKYTSKDYEKCGF